MVLPDLRQISFSWGVDKREEQNKDNNEVHDPKLSLSKAETAKQVQRTDDLGVGPIYLENEMYPFG